jgi:GWxTD domain-containing protein
MSALRSCWACCLLPMVVGVALCVSTAAQKEGATAAPANAASASAQTNAPAALQREPDPLKRPLDKKKQKQQAKQLQKELSDSARRWLDEDVRWIIIDEEREAFLKLSNDEEREQFIEQFWVRRDPTPDTIENEARDEHYRRIAYANEHFAAGKPGGMTDRGRIYIMWGPPDQIDSHPSGGQYQRPIEEGGGSTSTYPFETWRYRYLEGRDLGQEIVIEFVDTCMCGDYHMTVDPNEKDALAHVPRSDGRNPNMPGLDQSKQFEKLAQFAAVQRPPEVKFKDLRDIVTTTIRYNMLPFDVRADYVRVTSDTVLVPITIQIRNKDLTWSAKDGVQHMTVNIFGRVTTLTGRVAQTFEDTVTDMVTSALQSQMLEGTHVYWKALPLRSGRYRLDLALKDVNGDRVGTWNKSLEIPEYSENKLATSSLILADVMEKVGASEVGTGNFVLGTTKVRPRLDSAEGKPATFKQVQKMNIWMQVYNLGLAEKTNRTNASIEYDVVNTATQKSVWHLAETTEQLGNVGEQITLMRSVPLAGFERGTYEVRIKVDDKISKQSVSPSARFSVE